MNQIQKPIHSLFTPPPPPANTSSTRLELAAREQDHVAEGEMRNTAGGITEREPGKGESCLHPDIVFLDGAHDLIWIRSASTARCGGFQFPRRIRTGQGESKGVRTENDEGVFCLMIEDIFRKDESNQCTEHFPWRRSSYFTVKHSAIRNPNSPPEAPQSANKVLGVEEGNYPLHRTGGIQESGIRISRVPVESSKSTLCMLKAKPPLSEFAAAKSKNGFSFGAVR